jgi:hypothetical protein
MQMDATKGFSLSFFHQMSKSEVFFQNKRKSKFSHVSPCVLVLNTLVAFPHKLEHNYIYYSVIVVLGSVVIYYI